LRESNWIDIHDLDGDGFLSASELSSAMASFLEIFENDRDLKKSTRSLSDGSESDQYLKAVSSFLNGALKLGSNKGVQSLGRKESSKMGEVTLSFNEFLLAVLSQGMFVEYFEKVWSVSSVNSRVYLTVNK
jgi:hypothetical protein